MREILQYTSRQENAEKKVARFLMLTLAYHSSRYLFYRYSAPVPACMSFCRGKKTRVYGEQSREKHSKPKCTEAEKLKHGRENFLARKGRKSSNLQRQEKRPGN